MLLRNSLPNWKEGVSDPTAILFPTTRFSGTGTSPSKEISLCRDVKGLEGTLTISNSQE